MSKKVTYNYRRIFGNVLWALLGLATVVLLGAAINLKDNKHCKGVAINISGIQNNFFIDKNEINNILQNLCGGTIVGKQLGSFNLSSIENILRKDQWIKNAELFFDNNQVLKVNVSEREPVARIFTNTGLSFYTDTTLTRLPLSDKFSARVPVFTNFPASPNGFTKADSNLLKDVKNISDYILHDPFWMAQIDQIDITPNRTFEMIPKVGNQIIVFGNADNYAQKFNNLLTFYKQVETKVGWNKYSKIDLEYKDQIVAVKRGAQDILEDSLRVKQLMQIIVANAQQHANDSTTNIQLDQPKDDNNIPVATELNELPDEQTGTIKPITVTPNTSIQPSTEKPNTNLTVTPATEKPIEKPVVAEKIHTAEKKIAPSNSKPFWLQTSIAKPHTTFKKSAVKHIIPSSEKPNPYPLKKPVLKSSAKTANNTSTKKITKPITKPVTAKSKTKAKAVMPPNNDY